MMDATFEQQVRERAYGLWIEAGHIHGRAHEHWCLAEVMLKRDQAKSVPAHDASVSAGRSVAGAAKVKPKAASEAGAVKGRTSKSAAAKATKTGAMATKSSFKAAGGQAAKPTNPKSLLTGAKPATAQMVN